MNLSDKKTSSCTIAHCAFLLALERLHPQSESSENLYWILSGSINTHCPDSLTEGAACL